MKDNSDILDDLRIDIVNLINRYSPNVTGYELLGVLEAVKMDCHDTLRSMDEDDDE